jgi:hypothetical protein
MDALVVSSSVVGHTLEDIEAKFDQQFSFRSRSTSIRPHKYQTPHNIFLVGVETIDKLPSPVLREICGKHHLYSGDKRYRLVARIKNLRNAGQVQGFKIFHQPSMLAHEIVISRLMCAKLHVDFIHHMFGHTSEAVDMLFQPFFWRRIYSHSSNA